MSKKAGIGLCLALIGVLGLGLGWTLQNSQSSTRDKAVTPRDPAVNALQTRPDRNPQWEKIEQSLRQSDWAPLRTELARLEKKPTEQIKLLLKASEQIPESRAQVKDYLEISLPLAKNLVQTGPAAHEFVLLTRLWGRLDLKGSEKELQAVFKLYREDLVKESGHLAFLGTRPYPKADRTQLEKRLKSGQPQDIQQLVFLLAHLADREYGQQIEKRLAQALPTLPERSKLLAAKHLSVRMASQQLDPATSRQLKAFLAKQKNAADWTEINALVGELEAP